jgi:hypothetical protein
MVYFVLTIGVLIVAAIGINGRSYFLTRFHRTPSQPVVIRPSIAVLGFIGSSTAESADLSDALTEMFRTEMSIGGKLRSISGEDVAQMRRELSFPTVETLSKSSLELIRKNIGADYVLVGFGPWIEVGNLRFDVKIEDARTGDIIASTVETGPKATLFSMVSNAGTVVREKMGGGFEPSADTGALRASLPATEDARRLYLAGISRLRTLDDSTAAQILSRAAMLDPRSGRIQSALMQAWFALGYEKRASEAGRKALQLASGLSPEERSSLQGRYSELMRDWVEALNIYRSLWTITMTIWITGFIWLLRSRLLERLTKLS